MKCIRRGKAVAASVALALTLFSAASAGTIYVENISDVERVLNKAADWLFTILIAVGIVFLILAAFQYLSAAGNAEKLSQANRMMLYTMIAFALGIVARGVVFLVNEIIQ